MDISEVLDRAKTQRGFTSDNQLAIALGISRSAVSAWRKHAKAPSIEYCEKLANFSGLTLQQVHGIAQAGTAISAKEKRLWQQFAAALFVSIAITLPAQAATLTTDAYLHYANFWKVTMRVTFARWARRFRYLLGHGDGPAPMLA